MLHISRVTAILLIIAYLIYIWFQMRTQYSIYDAVLERDEEKDVDKEREAAKSKLTITECVIASTISITLVTLVAISLVQQIDYIVEERGVTEAFMGPGSHPGPPRRKSSRTPHGHRRSLGQPNELRFIPQFRRHHSDSPIQCTAGHCRLGTRQENEPQLRAFRDRHHDPGDHRSGQLLTRSEEQLPRWSTLCNRVHSYCRRRLLLSWHIDCDDTGNASGVSEGSASLKRRW